MNTNTPIDFPKTELNTMKEYVPDHWLVLKINDSYKVFATWDGGYLQGESWRRSSRIAKAELKDNHYVFHGASGSVYRCHVNNYGTTGYGMGILRDLDYNMVDKNTDFLKLDYGHQGT